MPRRGYSIKTLIANLYGSIYIYINLNQIIQLYIDPYRFALGRGHGWPAAILRTTGDLVKSSIPSISSEGGCIQLPVLHNQKGIQKHEKEGKQEDKAVKGDFGELFGFQSFS